LGIDNSIEIKLLSEMEDIFENASENFLELSSHQRLEILFQLLENKSKASSLAKKLDATNQEIHRNFLRLEDGGFISRHKDGSYGLTTYGKTMCSQVPTLVFLSKNRKYFESHQFGGVPQKFVLRVGQLSSGEHVKSVTKVLEIWRDIFESSKKYVYGILVEEPLDLIEPIVKRAKAGVKVKSVFSEATHVPKNRKKILDKLGLDDLIKKNQIERKMKKEVKTVVVLNEKEACVSFPDHDGETNITEMFYSKNPSFHEWCLDYFRYIWFGSDLFQERKLRL
jgi:predicted transcriptional regulator